MEKTIKDELLELGMKPDEIRTWCSDLHVKSTEVSRAYIESYRFKDNVVAFRSRLDNTLWFNIPFAHTEFHTKGVVVC